MTRNLKLAALLASIALALSGVARAQWDNDDYYDQHGDGVQARQYGYQNGYRDGVKQGRHEGRENDRGLSCSRRRPGKPRLQGWDGSDLGLSECLS